MVGVELSKDVFWVGVVDWNIRDFHDTSLGVGQHITPI